MKNKKPLTPTQKERKAVRAAIRRAEKQGIRFTDKLKASITKANYSKLKSYHKDRFRRLYAEGSALSESGEIVSGTRKRNELRIQAARKGAETRRARLMVKPVIEPLTPIEYKVELERQKKQTEIEKDIKYQKDLDEGQRIYENLLQEIETFSHLGEGKTGIYVKEVLNNEINRYGFETVMAGIASMPDDFKEDAQALIFYEHDGEKLATAYSALVTMIESTLPTQEQNQIMEDTLFTDTNFEVF